MDEDSLEEGEVLKGLAAIPSPSSSELSPSASKNPNLAAQEMLRDMARLVQKQDEGQVQVKKEPVEPVEISPVEVQQQQARLEQLVNGENADLSKHYQDMFKKLAEQMVKDNAKAQEGKLVTMDGQVLKALVTPQGQTILLPGQSSGQVVVGEAKSPAQGKTEEGSVGRKPRKGTPVKLKPVASKVKEEPTSESTDEAPAEEVGKGSVSAQLGVGQSGDSSLPPVIKVPTYTVSSSSVQPKTAASAPEEATSPDASKSLAQMPSPKTASEGPLSQILMLNGREFEIVPLGDGRWISKGEYEIMQGLYSVTKASQDAKDSDKSEESEEACEEESDSYMNEKSVLESLHKSEILDSIKQGTKRRTDNNEVTVPVKVRKGDDGTAAEALTEASDGGTIEMEGSGTDEGNNNTDHAKTPNPSHCAASVEALSSASESP